jgi:hypothetical protein
MAQSKLKTQSINSAAVARAQMADPPIIALGTLSGGDWTSNSTTPVDVGSAVTLSLGSKNYTVVAIATISIDGDTLNDNINTQISIGGSVVANIVGSARANPTASWTACPIFATRTGQTGSCAVKLQFFRQSGSGTVTARNSHGSLLVMAFPE